jgi:hypothetical protein
MKMLELLKDHPKTTALIKAWLLEKMLESLDDDSLPSDFKTFVREQGIEEDKVAGMLEGSPRALFDIFDEHKIFINIYPIQQYEYGVKINAEDNEKTFPTRIDADQFAVIKAFKLLEDKL